MSIDELSKILAAIVPLLVATVALIGGRMSRQNSLNENLELLTKLPDTSPARTKLEAIVDAQLDQAANQIHYTRNIPMTVVALLFSGGLVYGALQLFALNNVWGNLGAILAFLLSAVFMFGIFESLQNKDRR